jgi:hypothetical protein
MTELQHPTLQEQLFQDLLEINQAMARGYAKVLDTIDGCPLLRLIEHETYPAGALFTCIRP